MKIDRNSKILIGIGAFIFVLIIAYVCYQWGKKSGNPTINIANFQIQNANFQFAPTIETTIEKIEGHGNAFGEGNYIINPIPQNGKI